MFTTTAADGTQIEAEDIGRGPAVVVAGPGSDSGTSWNAVAEQLAGRLRLLQLHRRQYRLDLRQPGGVTMAVEASDLVDVITAVGPPVVAVGHSSGGVAVLEAMLRAPEAFLGACLYEPAVTIADEPWDEPLEAALRAIEANRPGRAMTIFSRDIVKMPGWISAVGGALVAAIPRYRRLAPAQIYDTKAIHDLGNRLDAYRAIALPVLLISGERSPAHLGQRIDALLDVLPNAEKCILHGTGHTANRRAPKQLAEVVGAFAERISDTRAAPPLE